MSENTALVLQEAQDLAVSSMTKSGSLADNILDGVLLVHSVLDKAGVPDEDGERSISLKERVNNVISKKALASEEKLDKAVMVIDEQADEIAHYQDRENNLRAVVLNLENKLMACVPNVHQDIVDSTERTLSTLANQYKQATVSLEKQITQVEEFKKRLMRQDTIEMRNRELQDECERVKLERDQLRDELAKLQIQNMPVASQPDLSYSKPMRFAQDRNEWWKQFSIEKERGMPHHDVWTDEMGKWTMQATTNSNVLGDVNNMNGYRARDGLGATRYQ